MKLTRRAVGALTVAGITGLAGCSGSTSFTAEYAETDTGETGYERTRQEESTISRTFAGQDVTVTNTVTEYQKEVDLGLLGGSARVGVFAAFTSPRAEIAGRTFNPISNWDNQRIINELQSRFSGMDDIQQEGTEEVEMLGSSRTVTKFSATTTYEGQEVPLFILMANFDHESDVVIPLGVYPQEASDQEGPNVRQLMGDLTHPA